MSNLFNSPWTNAEKIILLTNILQGAHPDFQSFLVRLIQDNNINPKWNDIALPTGRTLHSCQYVFDEITRSSQPRRSFSSMGPFAYVPAPTLTTSLSQKKSIPDQEPVQPMQRILQPRPPGSTGSPVPTTNGESLMMIRTFGPEFGSEKRKKRGRPTKEEAEERDRALAAEGKVYEPKKRSFKKARPSIDLPLAASESSMTTSPVIQTPLHNQSTEGKEDSSSGKRRPRRPEGQHVQQTSFPQPEPSSPTSRGGSSSSHNAAQSPSDRLLARFSEREQPAARPSSSHVATGSISEVGVQMKPDSNEGSRPST